MVKVFMWPTRRLRCTSGTRAILVVVQIVAGLTILQCATAASANASKAERIDGIAQKIINQSVERYRNLKRFSCSIKSTNNFRGKVHRTSGTFVYQAPRQYRSCCDQKYEMVGDGTSFYYSQAENKENYSKFPMPGSAYGREAIMDFPPLGAVETPIVIGLDPFQAPWGKRPLSLTVAKPVTIDNILVDIVVAKTSLGADQARIFYAVGQRDHLLRRVTTRQLSSNGLYERRMDFVDIKLNDNVTAATFVFTPPIGTKPISLEDNNLVGQFAPEVKIGEPAPPFISRDIEGREVSLEKFKGRVVLLDFWATWCDPCIDDIPYLQAAYKKYHDKGLEIVSISCDVERPKLEAFLKANALPWVHIYDKSVGSVLGRAYAPVGIPSPVLIGRDGKIVSLYRHKRLLEEAIGEAIAIK